MKKDIIVPALRQEGGKAVLAAWQKEVGEPIEAGQVLYEMETDKVVNQIEATETGVLVEVLVEDGDEVEAGQKIGVIEYHD